MNQYYDSCEIHKTFLICATMISSIEHLCKRKFERIMYTCKRGIPQQKTGHRYSKNSFFDTDDRSYERLSNHNCSADEPF